MSHLFRHRMGASCHELPNCKLPQLLEKAPVQIRRCMWLMFDAAHPHLNIPDRIFLHDSYPEG